MLIHCNDTISGHCKFSGFCHSISLVATKVGASVNITHSASERSQWGLCHSDVLSRVPRACWQLERSLAVQAKKAQRREETWAVCLVERLEQPNVSHLLMSKRPATGLLAGTTLE